MSQKISRGLKRTRRAIETTDVDTDGIAQAIFCIADKIDDAKINANRHSIVERVFKPSIATFIVDFGAEICIGVINKLSRAMKIVERYLEERLVDDDTFINISMDDANLALILQNRFDATLTRKKDADACAYDFFQDHKLHHIIYNRPYYKDLQYKLEDLAVLFLRHRRRGNAVNFVGL